MLVAHTGRVAMGRKRWNEEWQPRRTEAVGRGGARLLGSLDYAQKAKQKSAASPGACGSSPRRWLLSKQSQQAPSRQDRLFVHPQKHQAVVTWLPGMQTLQQVFGRTEKDARTDSAECRFPTAQVNGLPVPKVQQAGIWQHQRCICQTQAFPTALWQVHYFLKNSITSPLKKIPLLLESYAIHNVELKFNSKSN